MKLSEKGLKNLHRLMYTLTDYPEVRGDVFDLVDVTRDELKHYVFTPEDFTGAVVLTVEEAKGLLEIARDYRMYLFERCRIPLSLSSNEAFTALRERIEQAEKKK